MAAESREFRPKSGSFRFKHSRWTRVNNSHRGSVLNCECVCKNFVQITPIRPEPYHDKVFTGKVDRHPLGATFHALVHRRLDQLRLRPKGVVSIKVHAAMKL